MLRKGITGQTGYQAFFNEAGRAFCLYVVLGNAADRDRLVALVNSVLATVQITPAGRRVGLSQMGAWAGPFLVAALLLTVAGALKAYDPVNTVGRAAPGRAAGPAGRRCGSAAGSRSVIGVAAIVTGGPVAAGARRRCRTCSSRSSWSLAHGPPHADRIVRLLRQDRHAAEPRARRPERRRDRERDRGRARPGRRDRRRRCATRSCSACRSCCSSRPRRTSRSSRSPRCRSSAASKPPKAAA